MNQSTLKLDIQEYAVPVNRLKATACNERPQQRLENFGAQALSDTELIAILLGHGTRGHDVLTLSSSLMAEAGSIAALASWHEKDFQRLKGIGRIKGLQLVALMEVARRAISQQVDMNPILNRADLVADYLRPIVIGLDVEKFFVLCLNRRNRLIKRVEISSGTATSTLAHPREVFRAAIMAGATAGIIAAHNHPSGDPSGSAEDVRLTRQLREAANAVDIPLLDHVIIGKIGADPLNRGFFSFREAGLL